MKNKSFKNIRINELEIGEADSKTEINKKREKFYYFDGLNLYKKIKDNKSLFIISGRKGSGKSALASRFHAHCIKQKKLSNFIENNSLLAKMLSEVGANNINNKELLICFYKYVILIEISRMILKEIKGIKTIYYFFLSIKNGIFLPKMISILKSITKDFNNDIDILFKKVFISKSKSNENNQKNLSKVSIFESSVGVNESLENVQNNKIIDEIQYIPSEFYDRVDNLLDILIKLNKILAFNIIFDDIEDNRIFKLNDHFTSSLAEEFILIVKELNDRFINKNSRIIIVIRDDILDLINSSSNNINKVIEDHSIKINWISGYNTKMPPLIELVLSKIINNNESLNGMTAEEIYTKMLPKKIGEIPINNYIINATFGRPRDVILMFKKAAEISYNQKIFTEESFRMSRNAYSEYFYHEIKNELSLILEPEDLNNTFLIFKNLNNVNFSKKNIKEIFGNYKFSYFKDVDSFLNFCFEKSIIGILEKTNKGKDMYKWKYRNNELLYINNEDTNFTLHRGISKSIIGK